MRTNYKPTDVCSIIVTYNTNVNKFRKVLKYQKNNFNMVIIVNNSPQISFDSFKSSHVTIINNPSNIGLASAINVGILAAKKKGVKMVGLFDQDTILPDNFLQNMIENINNYQSDKLTALFSPIFFNNVTHEYGSIINFKPLRLIRSKPNQYMSVKHPKYVITSGSFISISVLDDVGLMREELFIDFVDIEWCLRARAKKYEIVVFPSITISHFLGDYAVTFLRSSFPVHSPLRMYYYFRNAIYLYRLDGIEWNWRLVDGSRNLFRFLFYMLFVNSRCTYFKFIIKGYYHGIIKKMGKFKE